MRSYEYNRVIHQQSFPRLLHSIPQGLRNETAQITSVSSILTTDRTQSLLLRAQGCNKAQANTVTYKHLSWFDVPCTGIVSYLLWNWQLRISWFLWCMCTKCLR